jgi:peptide/nickel transport system substrate-binding protein
MWKKVGIESEIVPFEQTALIRAANSRDFQVMLYRWQGGVDPDRNVYIFFHSKGSANRTGLNNPEMDRLLEAGRGTMDPAQRLQAYTAINNLLARELPYLFLTYFNNYSLAQTNVKGVAAIPDGLIRVGEVWKER